MQEISKTREHSFLSKGRRGIIVDGVIEVTSFDTSHVQMNTSCGGMVVEGEELKVNTLDLELGRVGVEGTVNGVFYIKESAPKKSLFGKNK